MLNKITQLKFIPKVTRICYGSAYFAKEERVAIEKVLDRNWWTLNQEGKLFEKELASFIGTRYCTLVNSGSSALLLAFAALHLPKGTKVIIPAVTFPTAFNAIILNGLVPFVVDVDANTLNISPVEAEKALQKGAKAILAVHMAGNPADIQTLKKLATKYRAILIEDNCDGLGGTFKSKKLGSFGDIACISMHAGHIISMGEGGAVLTNNSLYEQRAKSLRAWGRLDDTDKRKLGKKLPDDYPARYTYTEIGYNLRPLELQAAMGRVQLQRISEIKKLRQKNYDRLTKIFSGLAGVSLIKTINETYPSWFSFPLLYEDRGQLIKYLEKHLIETRPIFAGNILKQPAYENVVSYKMGKLINSDIIFNNAFFIGLHPKLPKEAFDYIEEVVYQFFNKKTR